MHASDSNTLPSFLEHGIDLTQPCLGTQIIEYSDDFFADHRRLLDPQEPVWIADKFDENGKWMDGWETRRRRNGGHDYVLIKLGQPSILFGVDINTTHFTGNYPKAAMIEGCYSESVPDEDSEWVTLVPMMELQGDSHHYVETEATRIYTHLRLHIYPDGGVARLRLYGRIYCDWESRDRSQQYDLVNVINGGRVIAWNDAHFGHPKYMLSQDEGKNMGDGWETRRRREPGFDWCIIELGHPGLLRQVIVDTTFFKGNFPESFSMQGAFLKHKAREAIITESIYWSDLLPYQKLKMDCKNSFAIEENDFGPISHIRINIFPDGGISRLRVFGNLAG